MNDQVAAIVSALARDPRFSEAVQQKIGSAVDTTAMEKQLETLRGQLRQWEFMRAFIERIDLYPEKQKCGNWIRNIVFNFPIPFNGEEVKELALSSKKGREAVI